MRHLLLRSPSFLPNFHELQSPKTSAMAQHFNQSDIDEFHDCFSLFARDKSITTTEELTIIMRSLGFSPTKTEITKYYDDNKKDSKIDFAGFLDIMHTHSQREKCQHEIMAAFQSHDRDGNGTVDASELLHILTRFGEKLTSAEAERLFKEANLPTRGNVPYQNILSIMLTPLPDY